MQANPPASRTGSLRRSYNSNWRCTWPAPELPQQPDFRHGSFVYPAIIRLLGQGEIDLYSVAVAATDAEGGCRMAVVVTFTFIIVIYCLRKEAFEALRPFEQMPHFGCE